MTQDSFTPLVDELDRWRAAGLTLPFWWRDDDAIAPTAALDRLRALSSVIGVPVHLAIIPEPASPDLANYLAKAPEFIPVQHGWSHRSHATGSDKKAEFGAHRPVDAMMDDIRRGQARLDMLLAEPAARMFVPPWNRIDPALLDGLGDVGFQAVSTYGPRAQLEAAPGLVWINTHIDPIDWRGTRDLLPPATLTQQIVQHLTDRRDGRADNTEPYGLLTHHLVHTDRIWGWTRDLMTCLSHGPVRPWRITNDRSDQI